MADYAVGDSVSVTADAVGTHPKYMAWNGPGIEGDAELPSGHRRLVYLDGAGRKEADCNVVPVAPPVGTDVKVAGWVAFIFAPDGSYIRMDGLHGIPTLGTPVVRIADNAPSRAVIRLPPSRGPDSVLAPGYAGWTGGYEGPIARGMELVVHFRDVDTLNTMRPAFRGQIYEVSVGEAVEITAYDRLMDLYQFSDQYQSHANYEQADTSTSRSTSGSNYVYQMGGQVGTLATAVSIDSLDIDPSSVMGDDGVNFDHEDEYVLPLPSVAGYTPVQGDRITQVRVSVFGWVTLSMSAGHSGLSYTSVYARATLYKDEGGVKTLVAYAGSPGWSTVASVTAPAGGTYTDTGSVTLTIPTDWPISDNASYYIGLEITAMAHQPVGGYGYASGGGYAKFNATKVTFTGDWYVKNGDTWTVGSGNHPEPSVTFLHTGSSIAVNLFTVSGSTVSIAQASIPPGPTDTYLSTLDAGAAMRLSYFIVGASAIQAIVTELLEWAGLTADVIQENMGTTSYYTTSTYDYLTCLQELLRGGNYGLDADIAEAGLVRVRPRHTTAESPVLTVSTEPLDGNGHIIIEHKLTSHWMAEKATVAYLAENVTSSGLPIALETDDALMDGSLSKALQSPLRAVTADSTLGTHDLMANAAGGKMLQLHTNIFEGSMVLAGYHVGLWDLSSAGAGGVPIGIEVPEYGASGVAVPTEIVLHDGVTEVSLDNIRTADRSEVARTVGLTADAISNNTAALPASSYVFARLDTEAAEAGLTVGSVTDVALYDKNLNPIDDQSNPAYIKVVDDAAGYTHIVAVFPAGGSGIAVSDPIAVVAATWGGTEYRAPVDNPKYAFDGQNVHVDIRVKRA